MAVRVSAEDFDAKVLQSELPVIVEFYSDSCIPCKQLSPILGGIEDDYEDKVNVYKVNVNFDAELAEKYAVMASPTIHQENSLLDREKDFWIKQLKMWMIQNGRALTKHKVTNIQTESVEKAALIRYFERVEII